MFGQPHNPEVVQGYRPIQALIPAHWAKGDFETETGARIHYMRTGGDKPSLLLLHGFQASGMMWLRTAMALEADYDVIMPDFRGHGVSSSVESGYSTPILVEDMAALIQSLKADRPVVVGHSMGAEIAGWLGAEHADLVRAVVLVDPALRNFAPPPTPDGELPAYMQPIIQAMNAMKTQPHTERLVTALNLLPPGTPVWSEADYVGFVDGMAAFDHATYRYVTDMGAPPLFESPDVIARIGVPVLLMTARPMMPGMDISAGVAAFENHWRDGRWVHFEDSGHFIPFDQFETFLRVLREFVSEVEGQAA
jgi:N-formylmaleamate deformylase